MEYLIISFIWWGFLAATVVSAGYHRYFSHGAFRAGIWYEYMVLILGPLSGSGPLLGWVGAHRMHHNHSDTLLDPHSPKYLGYMKTLTSTWKLERIPVAYVKDLIRNKRVMWFYKHHLEIRVATFLFGFALLPTALAVALIVMPVIYGYFGFGLLNTLCHWNGKVRNSIFVNILTMGEGWHINHHEDSRNWRVGKYWWQWDPAAWFIRLIKKS
jgi:stearoyl-CoA desaturase (delta-9 desaturase)